MYRILFCCLILIFSFLLLLVFTNSGFCISALGNVSGWVKSFPLRDGSRQIYLEWDAVAGATGYKVYRSSFAKGATPPTAPPSETDTSPDIVAAPTTNLTDTGLSNNYWYIYQVTAYDASTESTPSPEESYGIFIPEVRLKWEEIP